MTRHHDTNRIRSIREPHSSRGVETSDLLRQCAVTDYRTRWDFAQFVPHAPLERVTWRIIPARSFCSGRKTETILALGTLSVINLNLHPAVMSLKQAAAYLQVSKAHLSNVINGKVDGVPPVRCVRLGRRILIKREWIDAWLESERSQAIR
jgi:excisionase family DNA binding protein